MARIATYYTAETLAPMATEALTQLKYQLQAVYQHNGGTMGEMGNARTSVKRINAILRERGALKDAKGLQLTKDTSGLVKAAVEPLKGAAMQYAERQAREYVARIVAIYEGKDLNVVAPYPDSAKHSKFQYREMLAKRAAIHEVLNVRRDSYMPNAPAMLERDPEREARYIRFETDAAGVSFDAYVRKLEGKVGQGVTAASVEGHLWQGSILTIQKGDVSEYWHTQQIVNYSVLGNAYNQWPTRKMK